MAWSDVADKLAGWFATLKFGDALNVLLIAALIALVGGSVYWVGGTVLPNQTKMINDGLTRANSDSMETIKALADRNTAERAELHKNYDERLGTVVAAFKDSLDTQKEFATEMISIVRSNSESIKSVEKKVEDMPK